MVLDYTTTCAACSTPMTEPPRDGPDSMCAHMHTAQGRAEFKALLNRNRVNTDLLTDGPDVNKVELTSLQDVNKRLTREEYVALHTNELVPEPEQTRKEYMREYMRRRRAQ